MKKYQKKNPLLEEAELKNRIENNYGITDLSYKVIRNIRNTIYRLENETSRYIFKVYEYDGRSLESLKGEVELVKLLHDQGVNVSYPISDQSGNFIQNFLLQGYTLYGILYSFAEGHISNTLNLEQSANAGKQLGMMHTISSGLELKYEVKKHDLKSIINESLEAIKPLFKELQQEYSDLQEASMKVLNKLESFDLSALPEGYCHNDFGPTNLHFTADNSVTIFDFDNLVKGFLVIDIAQIYGYYFLLVFYGNKSDIEGNQGFETFIESYKSIRKLSDLEMRLLPYFCFGILIGSLKFNADYENDLLNQSYLKEMAEVMKELAG